MFLLVGGWITQEFSIIAQEQLKSWNLFLILHKNDLLDSSSPNLAKSNRELQSFLMKWLRGTLNVSWDISPSEIIRELRWDGWIWRFIWYFSFFSLNPFRALFPKEEPVKTSIPYFELFCLTETKSRTQKLWAKSYLHLFWI